ncbi:MAG: hypothetical protein CMP40_03585 [Rickettsiales bacterium]|nr:hypothetical protein [Rickettsiales bacterium]
MNRNDLNKISVPSSMTIQSVMERMNETAALTESKGFVVVVNGRDQVIGVVSDGDIRNFLAKKANLSAQVRDIVKRDFVSIRPDENANSVLRKFERNKLNLPVLDQRQRLIDLINYSSFSLIELGQQQIIRARVPGRISFSGGGTDLTQSFEDQHTAVLATTIQQYCTTSLLRRDDNEIHISSKNLGSDYVAEDITSIEFGDNLDLIKAAVKAMHPTCGLNVEVVSEIEPGTGLGGSSAMVGSVLSCLNALRGDEQLELYELADLAYQVERIEMGLAGGWQDQYATIFGGLNWIDFSDKEILVSPLRLQRDTYLELENNLLLFRVGVSRDSASLQQNLKRKAGRSASNNAIFKQIYSHSLKMRQALLRGQVKAFGDLLDQSWRLKKLHNNAVTNSLIESCYDKARKIGALGGKLLGAGSGGYLLIYAAPLYHKDLEFELGQLGAKRQPLNFSSKGVEVWKVKR